MRLLTPIRLVAIFEAAKGALVLVAGLGLLALVHRDLQDVAHHLVSELELDPTGRLPRLFIQTAGHLSGTSRWMLTLFAVAYALVRGVEAYGLWHGRRWAEWFAAVAGGIYIPVELYELFTKPGLLALSALLINLAIVWLMLRTLRRDPAHALPASTAMRR